MLKEAPQGLPWYRDLAFFRTVIRENCYFSTVIRPWSVIWTYAVIRDLAFFCTVIRENRYFATVIRPWSVIWNYAMIRDLSFFCTVIREKCYFPTVMRDLKLFSSLKIVPYVRICTHAYIILIAMLGRVNTSLNLYDRIVIEIWKTCSPH